MKRLVRFVLLTLGYLVAVARVAGRRFRKDEKQAFRIRRHGHWNLTKANRLVILAFVGLFVATGVNFTNPTPAYAVAYEPGDFALKMVHSTNGMLWNNFKGTNDDFNPGTGAFTIEGWFRPSSVCSSNTCDLFGKEAGFVFSIISGVYWYATYHAGSNWYPGWTSTGVKAVMGQWQHVAWVRNGQALTLYVNGANVWSNATGLTWASENISTTNAFAIGSRYGVSGESFDGLIDEVRFWKSARTSAEISDAKDRTLTPMELSDTALKGYWDFNDAVSSGSSLRTTNNLDPDAGSNSNLVWLSDDAKYQSVTSTTTVNGSTVVSFPRSFITQNGGWRVPQGVTKVDTLVVGGGGGGGTRHGGGGGAGGFVSSSNVSVVPGASKKIIVGGGGFPTSGAAAGAGSVGTDSYFGLIRALGGGSGTNTVGSDGGSGGGGGGSQAATNGIQNSTMGYGSGSNGAGGSWGNNEWNWAGGGGGGAGSVGSTGSPSGSTGSTASGGAGGNGLTNKITGATVCYAAGGGGGVNAWGSAGAGGKCGTSVTGGAGSVSNVDAADGAESSGSGGGGSGFTGSSNGYAGHGGTGAVIVSFSATAIPAAASGNCDVYKYNTVVSGTKYTYQEVQSTLTTGASATTAAANLNCNWTVPSNVTSVFAVLVGGGGGGGGDGGSGGGGGATRVQYSIGTLTPGAAIAVSVGTGGASGVWSGNAASAGGATTISGTASGTSFSYAAPGGNGGNGGPSAVGAAGGSSAGFSSGGSGGSGGAGAASGDYGYAGSAGFNATGILGFTRYFGGGGGGGVYTNSNTTLCGGAGGLGGGGQGTTANDSSAYAGESGKPNTGGGGGAGPAGAQRAVRGGVGGSGLVIFVYQTPSAGTILSLTTPASGNFLDGIVTKPVIQLVDDQGAAVSTAGVSVTATIDQSGALTNNIVNTDANGQASFAALTGSLTYNKYYSITYTATGMMPTSQLLPSGNVPVNLTISSSASSNGFFSNGIWYVDSAGDSVLNTTDLQTALNAGTNVTLQTAGGSVTVANSVATTGTSAGSLTMATDSSVSISSGASITLTGTNKALSIKAASAITTNANVVVNGPIAFDGGSISVQSNLTSSYLDSRILLKSKASSSATSASTLRTNSGKIVIWTDSDNSGGGNMALSGTLCTAPTATTCDTNATTGGDDIILGGGTSDATDSSLPGGFASGTAGTSDFTASGIQLGTLGTANTGPKIYSSGGNIKMQSQTVSSASALTVWSVGLPVVSGTEVNSGAGKIDLYAAAAAPSSSNFLGGIEFNCWGGGTTKFISTSTAADAIKIKADTPYGIGSPKIYTANSGTSFTNANGGGLKLQTNWVDPALKVSFGVTGPIVIEPVAASFINDALNLDGDYAFTANPAGLRLGKSGNALDVTVSTAVTSTGVIELYGGNVTANANLSVTNANAIILRANDDVVIGAGTDATSRRTLSTVGGAITLWSNADYSGSGAIVTNNFNSFLSRGGKITMAGSASANELAPTGFAVGSSSTTSYKVSLSDVAAGSAIRLGSSSVASNLTLSSDGGDILIQGTSGTNSPNGMGIIQYAGSTIDAGIGQLKIDGRTTGTSGTINSHAIELGFGGSASTLITSAKSSDTAIDINGSTSGSSSDSKGVNFWAGTSTSYVKVAATGTAGNIKITGSASTSSMPGLSINWARILSRGGSITLDSGTNPTAFGNSSSSSDVYVGADTAGGASGAINIKTASITWAGTVNIRTTGSVAIDSGAETSFKSGATFNWPSGSAVLLEVAGFRLGSSTNTSAVTVQGAIAVKGNVEIYGGVISTEAEVATSGGTITVTGSTFANSATKALSTDARDITVNADQMTIGASLTTNKSSGGIVSLIPKTAGKNVDLGATDTGSLLGLTDTELDFVTANVLRIGSASAANNINVSANISIAAASAPSLAIRGAGNVTNSNSATIAAQHLAISVNGTISLPGSNGITGNLALVAAGAAAGSGISFGTSGSYTADAVDSITPIYGAGKNISISSAPAVGATEVRYLNQTWSAPPVVTVKDAYGYVIEANNNKKTSYTTALTGSGTPTLAGATPVVSGGTQTFSALNFTSIGTTALTFSTANLVAGGTSSVTTGTYDVQGGEPASLAITYDATEAPAGKIGFGIKLTLKDSGGYTVSGPHATDAITVDVSDGDADSTNNAAVIAGGTQSTVAGQANFSTLRLSGKVGVTYTLTFTVTYVDSTSVTRTRSATRTVTLTPGDATKLKVQTPAGGFVNRTDFSSQPVIVVKDAYDNTVASSGTSVSVAVSAVDAPSTQGLTGTLSATTNTSGVATFAGLGKTGLVGLKRLTFSANNLSSDTQDFTLAHGAANKLTMTSPASTVNDIVFGTQPIVTIQDQDGNTVTGSTATVTLTSSNATIGGTLLNSAVAMDAVSGVANFDGKNVKLTGLVGLRNLTATIAGGITLTNQVTITYGAATKLFLSRDATDAVNGVAFGTQPIVVVQDISGNTVTNSTAAITVESSGSVLSGNSTPPTLVNGVATFSGLTLTGTNGTYRLTFKSTGLVEVWKDITVTFGAATKLALTGQPVGFVNRTNFTTQPVVTVQDASGNTVTNASMSIDVSSDTNDLTGTLRVNVVNGIATFSGLGNAGKAGPKHLTFKKFGGGLAVANFDYTLTYGAIHHLNVAVAGTLANDTAWAVQPVVTIQDQDDNTVDITDTVTLTATGATTVAIGGTTSMQTTNGVADFTGNGVKLTGLAGSKTLTAEITSGNGFAKNTAIILGYGVATRLALTAQPTGFTNRTTFTVQPEVTVQDISGNTVANSTISIDVSIDTGDVTGTTRINAVGGVATFAGLGKAGTIGLKTLTFKDTAGLLNPATKQFTLTHGAAHHTTLAVGSTLANNTAFATQPVVTIYDQDDNVVTSGSQSTQTVTLSVSGASTVAIGGSVTMDAADGVANFTGKGIKLTGLIGAKSLTATIASPQQIIKTETVTITYGAATKLAISTDAADALNGSAFGTQPVILVHDFSGNLVTNSTVLVTPSINNGTRLEVWPPSQTSV
jgi:hypothetical protein